MKAAKLRRFVDGWVNTFTGLGTDRDKRQGGILKQARNTTDFTFFEALYHGNDLAAKIADLAPKEMVREWIEFNAQQADSDDDDGRRVETPQENKEVSDAVIEKLHEIKARKRLKEAATWARVYGGSLVLLGVDDGTDPKDPNGMAEPLDIRKVQSLDFLTVFDRFEVSIDRVSDDPSSELFGLPETYRINPQGRSGQGTTQGSRVIHSSELDGLLYDTDYEYRVQHLRSDGAVLATFQDTFKTRLPAGDSMVMVSPTTGVRGELTGSRTE